MHHDTSGGAVILARSLAVFSCVLSCHIEDGTKPHRADSSVVRAQKHYYCAAGLRIEILQEVALHIQQSVGSVQYRANMNATTAPLAYVQSESRQGQDPTTKMMNLLCRLTPAWMARAPAKFQKEQMIMNAPIAVIPRPNPCARWTLSATIHPAMKR